MVIKNCWQEPVTVQYLPCIVTGTAILGATILCSGCARLTLMMLTLRRSVIRALVSASAMLTTISLFGPTNPGLTGAYGRTQIHQASDWPCAPCLQKKCTYKPSADDLRRFDLKREWPLCFTRLNPERVARQLGELLRAEDVR